MILTKLEYLRRFTTEERVRIRAAAATNPVLADYLALMELAGDIDTADPDTISAVILLETAGLLEAGRAHIILGDPPPAPTPAPTGTARVYRVGTTYITCLSTDPQPEAFDAVWDISALYAALIAEGADISDAGGVLTIGKQVA